jgi:hypothetical protein
VGFLPISGRYLGFPLRSNIIFYLQIAIKNK